jgi:hypothetical protein
MNQKIVISSKCLKFVKHHQTAITTAIELFGFVTTVVLASNETLKVQTIINRKSQEKGSELSKGEKLKEYSFLYWPSVLSGCVTAGVIVHSNISYTKHVMALADTVMLSQKAFSEYKNEVIKQVGKNKEKKIVDSVAQENTDRIDSRKDKVTIIDTGEGDVTFRLNWNGKTFKSTRQAVDTAFNILNKQLGCSGNYDQNGDNYVTLNDLYDCLKIDWDPNGSAIGWTTSYCYSKTHTDEEFIPHSYSATISKNGNTPIMVIHYDVVPIPLTDSCNWPSDDYS